MRTSTNQMQLVSFHFIDQYPVGINMTVPMSFPVANQFVVLKFWLEKFFLGQSLNDGS